MSDLTTNLVAPPVERLLVCPECRSALEFKDSLAHCISCKRTFERSGGIWDFVLGERFPSEQDPIRWEREEMQDRARAARFSGPLFRSFPQFPDRPLRLLSVGCGVAAEVDRLNEEGFECYGIDSGNRAAVWERRDCAGNLLLANGMHLPFPDTLYDVVFAGCVMPHVGVVGDTFEVKADYWEERLKMAREMVRVLRSGGTLVISCPNRLFPLDLFHRNGDGYMPRLHSPGDRFLLSLADFRKLFVEGCGCKSVRALPIDGYWMFNQLSRSFAGRVFSGILGAYMKIISLNAFRALRGSWLSPWLIVAVER